MSYTAGAVLHSAHYKSLDDSSKLDWA